MARQPRTPDDFAADLEVDLRARGEPYSTRELRGFVRDFWPLILDNPDPARWSQAFLDEAVQKETEADSELESVTLDASQAPQRRTRGIGWVLGLALLGVLFGGAGGAAWYVKDAGLHGGVEPAARAGMTEGALVGGAAGGALGAIVWAFFPYHRGPR